jgi:ATP-binding cassette subfamily B multidrug efflux pump
MSANAASSSVGGQRQRMAIARVMLKDAPILLLDEATSALDSEVETRSSQPVQADGRQDGGGHRAPLSTIAAMDRLVVMDQGRIVESGGDHQSLLAAGGIYAKLWAHQSGGFLGEASHPPGVSDAPALRLRRWSR